jgi:hypothetical protein
MGSVALWCNEGKSRDAGGPRIVAVMISNRRRSRRCWDDMPQYYHAIISDTVEINSPVLSGAYRGLSPPRFPLSDDGPSMAIRARALDCKEFLKPLNSNNFE